MKRERIFALGAGALALAGALFTLRPPGKVCDPAAAGESRRCFDVDAFAHLPVLEGGRVKPVDSVARNALLMMRSKQTVRDEGRTVSASTWLLDLMFLPSAADKLPSFYVDDPEVLSLTGHTQKEGRYYSFEALSPRLDAIQTQAQAAHAIDAKSRTRFQSAVVNLFDRLYLYYRLRSTAELAGGPPLAQEIAGRGAGDAVPRQEAMVQLGVFRPLPPGGPPATAGSRSARRCRRGGAGRSRLRWSSSAASVRRGRSATPSRSTRRWPSSPPPSAPRDPRRCGRRGRRCSSTAPSPSTPAW